jgi:hypothetical protein
MFDAEETVFLLTPLSDRVKSFIARPNSPIDHVSSPQSKPVFTFRIFLSFTLLPCLSLYLLLHFLREYPSGEGSAFKLLSGHNEPVGAFAKLCPTQLERTAENAAIEIQMDRHLTDAQCDLFFPGLYLEIQRSKGYWMKRKGISKEQKALAKAMGWATVIVQNGRMYVTHFEEWGHRTRALLASIRKYLHLNRVSFFYTGSDEAVITSLDSIPDVEFSLSILDAGNSTGNSEYVGLPRRCDI